MRLVTALLAEGGSLADAVEGSNERARGLEPGPAQVAASGPRVAQHADEYELLLEMILEGSLLHYGSARIVQAPDPDLALLLGDQLYALGLERLAKIGDIDAVAELADVISLVAQAHASSDPALADAIWQAGAVAIGWGPSGAHEDAKALVRVGDPAAEPTLRRVARLRRSAVS